MHPPHARTGWWRSRDRSWVRCRASHGRSRRRCRRTRGRARRGTGSVCAGSRCRASSPLRRGGRSTRPSPDGCTRPARRAPTRRPWPPSRRRRRRGRTRGWPSARHRPRASPSSSPIRLARGAKPIPGAGCAKTATNGTASVLACEPNGEKAFYAAVEAVAQGSEAGCCPTFPFKPQDGGVGIEQTIAEYGGYFYLVTIAWTALEGETFVLLAGYAASHGLLNLPILLICAWLGSFAGDQFYFWLGRRYGTRVLQRFPRWQPGVDRALRLLERYNTGFILSFRFIDRKSTRLNS